MQFIGSGKKLGTTTMSRQPEPSDSAQQKHPQVRKANERDAGAIARIYNYHVDLGGSTFDTEHWSEEQVRRLLQPLGPEVWLVAECPDSILGWASARWYSMRHGYRLTLETAIYLKQSAMGTGVGRPLQQQLEQHCRKNGIHHLVAKIDADNQRSVAFHHSQGYELVGIQKEVGFLNGHWKDVVILQKILQSTKAMPSESN